MGGRVLLQGIHHGEEFQRRGRPRRRILLAQSGVQQSRDVEEERAFVSPRRFQRFHTTGIRLDDVGRSFLIDPHAHDGAILTNRLRSATGRQRQHAQQQQKSTVCHLDGQFARIH